MPTGRQVLGSGAASDPIVVPTKSDLVRERIEAAIMSGDLQPGQRIVVDVIARELGTSKIPVREALSRLESLGLVVQSPHAGARVAPLTLHELHGVYLLRQETETLAARLAAPLIDEGVLSTLSELNAAMKADIGRDDVSNLSPLNRDFHLTIAQATTYQTIVDVIGSALRSVHRYRVAIPRSAGGWQRVTAEHDAIIEALSVRDAERSAAAMRAHISRQLETDLDADAQLLTPESPS